MHELWVCTNKCCNRYKPGYAEALKWMKTQPPFKSLETTTCGNRLCNHCGASNSWVDRTCPRCGTRFGMLKPDSEKQTSISVAHMAAVPAVQLAEMMKSALSLHNIPMIAPSAKPQLQMLNIHPARVVDDQDEDQDDDQDEDQDEDQDDSPPRCEVCGWYNPHGIIQCERCTAFLLVIS